MTLNFGGGLFPQRDVRETPKNAPAASTALGFITISNEADLTADRVLTAGAGISVTDGGANTTATVANTGVTSNVAGEGIDVSGATGAVTISGENATTANKGIASFNTDDFTVAAGAVSLKSKTSYWSATGSDFLGTSPDTDTVDYDANSKGSVSPSTDNKWFNCPVHLPHGAIITAVTVYGNAGATAETYTLLRTDFAFSAATTMATANIGTEDSTISSATIDNSSYHYWIRTSTLDIGDTIYGARITYTTDYI